jgi:hypothetical protein
MGPALELFPRKPSGFPLYESHRMAMGAHWAQELLEDHQACARENNGAGKAA